MMINNNNLGLYIHIPFCAKKCPYCDFYSVSYSKDIETKYVESLIESMKMYSTTEKKVDTIYFGGGTPSLITANSLDRILTAIDHTFSVDKDVEITLESNPKTLTDNKLFEYKKLSVNRISLGMQSAVESELAMLKRIHTPTDVKNAIENIKKHGIENISLDFMINTPNQTLEKVKQTIEFIKNVDVKHISMYMLKIEEDTEFNNNGIINSLPCEDVATENYLTACHLLEELGFKQYEISNFAKDNFSSVHNLKYWNMEEYIGLGPFSHSFYDKKRYYHPPNIMEFIDAKGANTIIDTVYSDIDMLYDYLMLRLRLVEGVNLDLVKNAFDIESIFEKANLYRKHGLVEVNEKNINLTRKGFLLSNTIIAEFLDCIKG